MVDARGRGGRHLRLGVVGDAEAGFRDHVHVVGAVADRHGLGLGEPELLAQLDQRRALAVAAEDRLGDLPASLWPSSTVSVLARASSKPIMAAMRSVNRVKPPDTMRCGRRSRAWSRPACARPA